MTKAIYETLNLMSTYFFPKADGQPCRAEIGFQNSAPVTTGRTLSTATLAKIDYYYSGSKDRYANQAMPTCAIHIQNLNFVTYFHAISQIRTRRGEGSVTARHDPAVRALVSAQPRSLCLLKLRQSNGGSRPLKQSSKETLKHFCNCNCQLRFLRFSRSETPVTRQNRQISPASPDAFGLFGN